jgi:lysozyme family protein
MDLNPLVDFVLKLEDPTLAGHVTTLRGDSGGMTRFGIASKWHPDLVASGFFDEQKTPRDEALAIARTTYEEQYAKPLLLDQLTSAPIGARLLAFAVNAGPSEAVALAQRTLCNSDPGHIPVAVDGCMGPETVAALNGAFPADFVQDFRQAMAVFYERLVAARPELLPERTGLLNRAGA